MSDEATLEGIEELLFTDEEFCTQVALAEDSLINDFVLGRLDEQDAASFEATLAGDPERRFNLGLTRALREKALAHNTRAADAKPTEAGSPSFFASLKAFFRRPGYAVAFAALVAAVLVAAGYFGTRRDADELAELRAIYREGRPNESRIAEFDHAPLAQLRGAPEPRGASRLRLIENRLIEAAERNPSAGTRRALGVFYLTQQKYADAAREFEAALKLGGVGDAKLHNDLGAAYLELARASSAEKRLEALGRSLEEFKAATARDANLLEPLFNQSLALEELGLAGQAKASWSLYLQKDSSSPWAEEARRHLARLEGQQTRFKSDGQVLDDFLAAHRAGDEARARRIHDETKGVLKGASVPLQLSRRYLLAKRRGDDPEARESVEALASVGRYERAEHDESFFAELADFYAGVGADRAGQLLEAKDVMASAQGSAEHDFARAISEFERSRDLFRRLGDEPEAALAEGWAAQFLPDVGKVAEGRRRLAALAASAGARRYQVLVAPAYYWLAVGDYKQNALTQANRNFKTALRLAEAGGNVFEVRHAQEALASYYSDLGELEPALAYASRMLPREDPYYQSPGQSWRDKGTLADLCLKLKFFSASLSFSREGLAVAREVWPGSGRANSNLRHMVAAASAAADFDAALGYAAELGRLAAGRGAGAENTQRAAEDFLLLADVKSRMNDCGAALADYDRALALYGRLPEFAVGSYRIHKGRLFCFRQLGRREDFAAELKTVLALSEQYRANIREDDSRRAFFSDEQVVFDAAVSQAIEERDARGAFRLLETSRARSLLDFVESEKSVTEVEAEFASVSRPLSLEEIQARLPDEVQLVEYAVLPDRLAVWVVARARFDLIERSITADGLEKKLDAYRAALVGRGPEAVVARAGRELYELLIPPGLDASKQLCVVADKSLHQLPFAALVAPSGKYLLEEFALSYAPSASVLVLATENARRKGQTADETLLSVGNPDFDREEYLSLADLRSAADEAKATAAGYFKSTLLVGRDATKEAFLRGFADAEVIHFAGHFVANRRAPGNSKLLFAGGELRSAELGAYKLPRAKLVVLSACETGFERYDKSEGAVGIARTFLALGAPVVVASQWQVDSEPTKELMVEFHRNRREKRLASAESLRRAQLDLMSRGETRAPFYWAAFSLFGGHADY